MNISKQMKKVGIVAAIGAASALSSAGANAATLYFIGGDKVIDPSVDPSTFSLDLVVDGLADGSLGGGVGISFDQSIINVTGITIGSAFGATNEIDFNSTTNDYTIANSNGYFGLVGGSFSALTTGVIVGFASINFEVVAGMTGTSNFTFSSLGAQGEWSYTPPAGLLVANEVDEIYCLTTDPGFDPAASGAQCLGNDPATRSREVLLLSESNVTVVPTVVPVPAAVWLFGSGLIGLVAVSRRKAV